MRLHDFVLTFLLLHELLAQSNRSDITDPEEHIAYIVSKLVQHRVRLFMKVKVLVGLMIRIRKFLC